MIHDPFTTFLILVSFIFITTISIKLYPRVYGKSIMPTGSKFFLLNYIFFIYTGVFLMNIFHFEKLASMNLYSTSIADKLLPMYILGIITLPLFFAGSWFANTIFKYKSTVSENILLKRGSIIRNNKFYKSPPFIFITTISILFSFYVLKSYISRIDMLPILYSLGGEYNVSELRSAATNDFAGKVYRFNLIMKTLPLFFFTIFYLLQNKKIIHKIATVILSCVCIFTSIMDGEKAPLIQFFMFILILSCFTSKSISLKKIMIYGGIAFLSMCIMYMFFMNMADRNLSEIVVEPLNRTFLGSAIPMLYYLDYVPAHSDYLWGQSFPNPGGIFPFEWRRITVEIKNYYFPEIASRGIVGSMPATFYGEFYLNFGYIGALFSMPILGFLLKSIDIFLIRIINNNKLFLPLLALFFIYVHIAGRYFMSSFMGIFFNEELLLLTLISFILIFLNSLHNKSRCVV